MWYMHHMEMFCQTVVGITSNVHNFMLLSDHILYNNHFDRIYIRQELHYIETKLNIIFLTFDTKFHY
jgi:hypothetical protein